LFSVGSLCALLLTASPCTSISAPDDYFVGWAVGTPDDDGPTVLCTTNGRDWFRQGLTQLPSIVFAGVASRGSNAWIVGEPDGGYGSIYCSSNDGATWVRQGDAGSVPDYALLKCRASGDETIWAVGYGGSILHTTNGGATWTNTPVTGYTQMLQSVTSVDGETAWAGGVRDPLIGFAGLFHTTNGGATWEQQTQGGITNVDHLLGLAAVDAQTAWGAGGDHQDIILTTNGGTLWEQKHRGPAQRDGNEICVAPEGSVWAATDSTIFWTTNNGLAWSSAGVADFTLDVNSPDGTHVWAVRSGWGSGIIYYSPDAGVTWTQQVDSGIGGLANISMQKRSPVYPSDTHFVWTNSPSPAEPYTNWDTAAHTIQEAIDAATNGNLVVVADGLYVVTNQLVVTQQITLVSVNGADSTIVRASSNRCLYVTAPATIVGFTFTNGYVNTNPYRGAGMYAYSTGMTVRNCRFERNYTTSSGAGGGLWVNRSAVVEDCVFIQNRADTGGALYGTNDLVVSRCTFTSNLASGGSGGAVFCEKSALVTGCVFEANWAGDSGGGFCCWTYGTGVVVNSRFIGNDARSSGTSGLGGGAVYLRRSGVVRDSYFSNNRATNEAGAVHFYGTNCLMERCELYTNSGGSGGAFAYRGAVLDCIMAGNRASGGGAIYCSDLSVDRSRILNNYANNNGGGANGSSLTIRDTLITGNTASNQGGGLYISSDGSIENSTVIENSSPNTAGIWASGSSTVRNSIVYGNLGKNYSNRAVTVTYEFTCTAPDPGGTGNTTNDPAFLFPSAGNCRLATNSPCRDAGTNQAWMTGATDLDGQPRVVGPSVDMGAYELGALITDFQAVPTLGVAPFAATFSAVASGTNAESVWFLWDFENDGSVDTQGLWAVSPTHTFTTGVYSVCLAVSNSVGETAQAVRTDYIVALERVIADFTAVPQIGAAPLVVQFTDDSTNNPQYWAWDFDGDGFTDSTEQNPSHTYTSTGLFTVALTVSNDFGGGSTSSDTIVKTNYVSVPLYHLVADFTVNTTNALTYDTLQFTDLSSHGPTYWTWYFRNVGTGDSFEQNPTSYYYTAAGFKTVKLTVSNEYSTATVIKTNYMRVTGPTPTHYVAPGGGNHEPYTNWATAAHSIDAAMDAAENFDTIYVSNGTYGVPMLGLMFTDGIILQSVNGPSNTIITGGGSESVIRAGFLNTEPTLIDGFTITNGYSNGDAGGVLLTWNSTLQNCIITGCRADGDGGGVYLGGGGVVSNCVITRNAAGSGGGGIHIRDGGTVTHSRVIANMATNGGGGIYLYSTNPAAASLIDSCLVVSNSTSTVSEDGGGVYIQRGTLRNSLLLTNWAERGGGVYASTYSVVEHCTIAGNAATHGGGIYFSSGCTALNCVVWGNTRSNIFRNTGVTVIYSDTTPSTTGEGNLNADPAFADSSADWHLTTNSPCVDAGTNACAVDFEGLPRPLDGNNDGTNAWDMGAYEFVHPAADSDGDHFGDACELPAGTDPLDSSSFLGLLSIVPDAGLGVVVRWSSVTGRSYRVEGVSVPGTGEWALVEGSVTSTPPANACTDTTAAASWMYRVGVE
jgi:predicted outer membrane repeat protein